MAHTRHEDAATCLHRLLDRHEERQEGEGVQRALAEQVSQNFSTLDGEDAFRRAIEAASRAGAVRLEMDRGDSSHAMKRVVLVDADRLFAHLRRAPRAGRVGEAWSVVERALGERGIATDDACLSFALSELRGAWERGRKLFRIGSDDTGQAVEFLVAVQAAFSKSAEDPRDLRSYSTQVCNDSKLIERQMSRILGLARLEGRVPEMATDEEAIAALGLEKFLHLVEIAGDLPGLQQAFAQRRQTGIHPDLVGELELAPVRSLLTIENYASFNLHVRHVMGPGEVVLYTGGWPGRGVRACIARLAGCAERIAHWGDIDMAGAGIADAVWRAAGRDIELHLMDPELARMRGRPGSAHPLAVSPASPAADLVQWLATPEAFTLEQEEISPQPLSRLLAEKARLKA